MSDTYTINNKNGSARVGIPDPIVADIINRENLHDRIVALYKICPDKYEGWAKLEKQTNEIKEDGWTEDPGRHEAQFRKKKDQWIKVTSKGVADYVKAHGKARFKVDTK